MERYDLSKSSEELSTLSKTVRELIGKQDYRKCEDLICSAIGKYPHAPEPHNLIGILLEKTGDHLAAMKHFRAAWALDPTYIPARQNLDCYGTFFSNGKCAYDESDYSVEEDEERKKYEIEYDKHGIGHIVRKD